MALFNPPADNAPPPGDYSHSVVAHGMVFSCGLGPHDPVTRSIVGSTIEDQTRQTLRNLGAVLAGAGVAYADVVKMTVHLADLPRDFTAFCTTYREFFEAPFPVRTTVGSTLNGFLVEVDVVAALPEA